MDGVMNERTIRVSNNRPRAMVVPIWPSTTQIAVDEGRHGEGEHQSGGGDDPTGTRHGPDDAGVQSGADLFFEPGYQQQVVVRTHCKQEDYRQVG